MPEFDIDQLKKTWQEQPVENKYGNSEILEMLNKKSRNYVKYIFWISAVEFLLFCGVTLYYMFWGDDTKSFMDLMNKLGITNTPELEKNFSHMYFLMKILSLVVTAIFTTKFYLDYKKINVESNLKKFITQIFSFRRTVNMYILTNIFILVLTMVALTLFVMNGIKQQHIQLDQSTFNGLIVGLLTGVVLAVVFALVYYRLVYGILVKRLGKNMTQLKEIEEQQ